MKQTTCPICDQAMLSKHYCKNCRKWIKEPYVKEFNYHLNENHPDNETKCTYHVQEPDNLTIEEPNKPSEIFFDVPEEAKPIERPFSVVRTIIYFFVIINILLPLIGSILSGIFHLFD